MKFKTAVTRFAGMMLAIAVLLGLPAAQQATAIEVVVSRLDGRQAEGELLGLANDSISLDTGKGGQTIPTSSVHWLRSKASIESPGVTGSHGHIELAGGSVLPTETILLEDGAFRVELSAPLATQQDQAFETTRAGVRSYVFRIGSPAQVKQWRRIRRSDPTADLIVVKRKSGESLDYVEGIVKAIDADRLTVSLDGEVVGVPLTKVYGVVCFHPEAKDSAPRELLHVVTPEAGLRAVGVSLDSSDTLLASLPEGVEISVPLAFVTGIDFSRGGVVSLSDLEPDNLQWRPLFTPPGEGELALQWGLARRDRSYSGQPLSLRTPGGGLQEFSDGLAIRTNGRATYTVPKTMRRLMATVGVAPSHRCPCRAVLRIEEDGARLFEQTIKKRTAPLEIDVPVTPGATLSIVVQRVEDAQSDAVLHLCQARFTR
ncbi:MAG: NPCBM/NEW2 domain-containing protein [Planctomycetales bacterium]|nr:NPCBM/NEW2 domain-containing protein [Planctomycetales bacterium]